ncbi:hypothetical protein [Sphingomonas daechungensis]|uniref:hypothetical protein n=1 Tax=Sphingomonas daechungensis TaxID=1176646 RepID=UPI0031EC1B88
MPAILKEIGAKAIVRHEKRDATPEIEIGVEGGGWTFRSPYEDEDLAEWEALLFDAFATRSIAAFQSFATQLAELCSTDWHGDEKGWLPNSSELRAAIQVVRSLRPRDEAEACLAAQMVAVHLMQIKLSAQALKQSYPDPRTCAIAGKLGRTYAMQLETMAKLRGKVTRQRITVRKYSQHEHKHIHLHQGEVENGNQPHGPREREAAETGTSGQPSTCSALSSPDATGNPLSVASDQGSQAMSTTWGRKRIGRSDGRS